MDCVQLLRTTYVCRKLVIWLCTASFTSIETVSSPRDCVVYRNFLFLCRKLDHLVVYRPAILIE